MRNPLDLLLSFPHPIPADTPPKKDQIDKKTLEIEQADDSVYRDMQSLAEELPDHSPRFVLLSYPLTLVRPSSFQPPRPLRLKTEWPNLTPLHRLRNQADCQCRM